MPVLGYPQVKQREPRMPGIIAGTDGSGHSQRALEWAVREAAARHLPLVVIAVYQAAVGAWGSAVACLDDPVLAEHAQKEAQAQVDEALAGSYGSQPVSVAVRAVGGNPADVLLRAAEDADMIVVGSRGAGGFARLPLGSVASHLVHHAHRPVVIIPAADRD
jgi:nucleotide-binding universal stress UspA family protein